MYVCIASVILFHRLFLSQYVKKKILFEFYFVEKKKVTGEINKVKYDHLIT